MASTSIHQFPAVLLELDGHCGPISAWMAIRYFRKRIAAERLIKLCRHTKKYGTFTISIAVALKRCGLHPNFHTEEDNEKKPIELIGYRTASHLGIPILPPLSLDDLRKSVSAGKFVIVFFDTEDGEGHFSPVASIDNETIAFAFGNEDRLTLETFQLRWSAPGILRQAVVING